MRFPISIKQKIVLSIKVSDNSPIATIDSFSFAFVGWTDSFLQVLKVIGWYFRLRLPEIPIIVQSNAFLSLASVNGFVIGALAALYLAYGAFKCLIWLDKANMFRHIVRITSPLLIGIVIGGFSGLLFFAHDDRFILMVFLFASMGGLFGLFNGKLVEPLNKKSGHFIRCDALFGGFLLSFFCFLINMIFLLYSSIDPVSSIILSFIISILLFVLGYCLGGRWRKLNMVKDEWVLFKSFSVKRAFISAGTCFFLTLLVTSIFNIIDGFDNINTTYVQHAIKGEFAMSFVSAIIGWFIGLISKKMFYWSSEPKAEKLGVLGCILTAISIFLELLQPLMSFITTKKPL